jgi:hypothetical protein
MVGLEVVVGFLWAAAVELIVRVGNRVVRGRSCFGDLEVSARTFEARGVASDPEFIKCYRWLRCYECSAPKCVMEF